MLCMHSTITPNLTSPMCAYRSCTTSKVWKWRETWRESWSRSCSQTQNTLLCWQAGATLLEVCSSRCPSALPLTWSRPSPAPIRLRVTRWPLNCPTSRRAHVSGQCTWEKCLIHWVNKLLTVCKKYICNSTKIISIKKGRQKKAQEFVHLNFLTLLGSAVEMLPKNTDCSNGNSMQQHKWPIYIWLILNVFWNFKLQLLVLANFMTQKLMIIQTFNIGASCVIFWIKLLRAELFLTLTSKTFPSIHTHTLRHILVEGVHRLDW